MKANLFIRNIEGKSPLTINTTNLLMTKILKKAMALHTRELFEDAQKIPKELHLINKKLLQKLSEKYNIGAKRKNRGDQIYSLKSNLKLISHYLKFPSVLEKNRLFAENKF